MLQDLFAGVEIGTLPPADGTIRVVPQPSPEDAAVVAFSAHILIVADVPQEWVDERLPAGNLSAPLRPSFLFELQARLGRRVNIIDMVMVGPRLPGEPTLELKPIEDSGHPRVQRALLYRTDVTVFETVDPGGMVLLGRGLAGRWEMAFEVDPAHRGRGLGRELATAARHLVDANAVWAQVSPGNAASVRALVAAGYRPVGSEALLRPPHDQG